MMVTLFTKRICPKCMYIKNELERHEIQFESVNLDEDESAKNEIVSRGILSAPVLKVNGEFIYDVSKMVEMMEREEVR